MAAFFQQTWWLWWAVAVVGILRWFRVTSADDAWEDSAALLCDGESYVAPDQARSSVT